MANVMRSLRLPEELYEEVKNAAFFLRQDTSKFIRDALVVAVAKAKLKEQEQISTAANRLLEERRIKNNGR